MFRRVTCGLAVALSIVGCSSQGNGSSAPKHSSPSANATPTTAAPDATAGPHTPSVAQAPKIASDGITPLTTGTRGKGSATYPIPGGIKAGKTLAIAINCQGPGRLRVQVQPTGISFPLLCEKGKVLPTMNEIHMTKGRTTSSLQFTAEPKVTWSFAIGWDPNPPEQR
jgi:hypothetical protein